MERSTDSARQSLSCCSFPVFVTTFIIMGLCVSVLGPSVIFFEEISNTWEDEIALLFTARSVGALGGWLLSVAVLEGTPNYCGCLMGVGLSGLTIINFSVVYIRRLWWLMAAFAIQGCFLVMCAQGCLSYVIARGGQRKRQIHQILVFCSLIGYALAPILMIPLTCGRLEFSVEKSSLVLPNASSAANHLNSPSLHRVRRMASVEPEPITYPPGTNSVPVFVTPSLSRVPITPSSFLASTEGHKTTLEIATTTLPDSHTSQTLMSRSSLTPKSPPTTSLPPSATGNDEQGKTPKPPLSGVASAKKQQATELATASTLQTSAGPVNRTSSPVRTLPNTTTTQTEVPKKPSIVDAMHLSQDSRTADGSKTVAKMKEVDEDARLTVVDRHEQAVLSAKPPASLETSKLAKVKPQPINTTVASAVSPPRLQSAPSANATTPSLLQVKSVNKNKTPKPQPSQTEVDPQDRKKPSVVDAVHLKQDHKSADGSETAVKMKEDVRLNDVRKVPPKVEVEKPSPVPAIEVGGQNKPAASPLNHPLSETSRLPPHSSQQLPSPSGNLSEDETATTDETGIFPPAVVQPIKTTKNEGEAGEDARDGLPAALTKEEIPAEPSVEEKLALEQRSNDSYSLHSSYTSQWNRFAPRPWTHSFTREQYISAIQRVYLALCLLTVMAWFIVLPLTGLNQHLRSACDRCCNVCLLPVSCPLPFLRRDKHGSFDMNLDLEAAEKTNLLNDPKCPSLPAVPTRKVSPKYFRFDESPGLDSADVGIELAGDVKNRDAADRHCVVFRQTASSPNFAVLRSPQPALPKSTNGLTPALSTYWAFNAEPTVWPTISWPRHFWLILAAFFFAGLETTYGAFVHTFTLRTLHWSPCDALWVTAVFWCGNVLGRLSCLCLGPSSDMGVTLLQGAIDLTSLHKPEGTSHPRRQRATKIAILVTRTAGALICVISAGMLKHFTKAYYVYQHKPANLLLELWSYSKDRATWIGSFGIGLGLGITACSGLSVCNRLGKHLHLAGLIGQMFLPAVAGYISERMFYKNASQTLGRTSLILSVLLFFSLVVDLVLRLIRHFSWWKNFTDFFRFMPVKKPAAKVTASPKRRVSSANVGSLEAPAGGQQSEPAGLPLREVSFSSPSSAARRPTLQVTVASHPGSD